MYLWQMGDEGYQGKLAKQADDVSPPLAVFVRQGSDDAGCKNEQMPPKR